MQVFPISARNSPEAIISMLTKTACHRIITTSTSLAALMIQVTALKPTDYDLVIEDAPTISQCYPHLGHETSAHTFTPYPTHNGSLDQDAIFVYLHSSGSTGLPKAIPYTSRVMFSWLSLGTYAPMVESSFRSFISNADPYVEVRNVYRIGGMQLPPFHAFGIMIQLFMPSFPPETSWAR